MRSTTSIRVLGLAAALSLIAFAAVNAGCMQPAATFPPEPTAEELAAQEEESAEEGSATQTADAQDDGSGGTPADPGPNLRACPILMDAVTPDIISDSEVTQFPGTEYHQNGAVESECLYANKDSSSSASLYLRYEPEVQVPASREEFTELAPDSPFATRLVGARDAAKEGTDVEGLGDTAFSYDLFGTTYVMVIKEPHLQMVLGTKAPSGVDALEKLIGGGKAAAAESPARRIFDAVEKAAQEPTVEK